MAQAFEAFKMPGADVYGFADARCKDVEVLVAANKVTFEALQALAGKQADMLTNAMQALQESGKSAMASGRSPGVVSEASQKAWEKTLADVTELAPSPNFDA